MSEAIKTIICVAVASVFGIGAYLSRPAPPQQITEDQVNQPLFAQFTDPLQAESMKIARVDTERGQLLEFEVADTDQGWLIESKQGYPANATEQMTKAANSLVGLKVLRVVSDSPQQHADFGVVEPNAGSVSAEDGTVGQLVSIKDDKGDLLTNLIIGVADKEKENLRYVRIPGRDRVYIVELDPSVFSTEFSDWINKDLLKLNPFDVAQLRLRNYSLQIAGGANALFIPRFDATLEFDQQANKWSLRSLKEAEGQKLVETSLTPGESLNTERLNELRNSFDDLTIVDVVRKPEQLAEALKQEKVLENLEMSDLPTLGANGFYPLKLPGETKTEIVGFNGELVIETQDAIRYRLLFGNERLGGEDKNEKQRFLFIQTELIDEMIPKPELQEVPEIKEGEGEDVETQSQKRDEILRANERAMDVYRQNLNTAKRKIYELNAQFADWYYVVSEEDFEKILVNRDQLIQSPKADAQTGQNRPPLSGSIPGLEGVLGGAAPRTTPPATDEKPAPQETMPVEDSKKPVPDSEDKPEGKPEEKPDENAASAEESAEPSEGPMKTSEEEPEPEKDAAPESSEEETAPAEPESAPEDS